MPLPKSKALFNMAEDIASGISKVPEAITPVYNRNKDLVKRLQQIKAGVDEGIKTNNFGLLDIANRDLIDATGGELSYIVSSPENFRDATQGYIDILEKHPNINAKTIINLVDANIADNARLKDIPKVFANADKRLNYFNDLTKDMDLESKGLFWMSLDEMNPADFFVDKLYKTHHPMIDEALDLASLFGKQNAKQEKLYTEAQGKELGLM
jgi:hypothetical protein